MVLVQKYPFFSTFYFQAIQARKMSFMIFQNEKTTFQAIKTRSSKSRKIDIFPKWLTHGFGQKIAIFPTFFLGNLHQENVFYDILEQKKTPFYAIKTKSPKKGKIDISPKGLTHGFGRKMAIFSTFFLGSIDQENVFCDILEQKKYLSRLYKQKVQKVEKLTFFQRG